MVYGLDWSPVPPARIAAVTNTGNFSIYDVESGRPLVDKNIFPEVLLLHPRRGVASPLDMPDLATPTPP